MVLETPTPSVVPTSVTISQLVGVQTVAPTVGPARLLGLNSSV